MRRHSDQSLGSLQANVRLDDSTRVSYGSEDNVTGNVQVTLEPNNPARNGSISSTDSGELFGPLQVDLILTGTLSSANGSSSTPSTNSVFVTKTVNLHTGSSRVEPGVDYDFPFSLAFPEHADAQHKTSIKAYQDSDGRWKFRQHLKDTVIEDLPPSLTLPQRTKSDLAIRYKLAVKVNMPGIDVTAGVSSSAEILYERPRVPHIAARIQSADTTSFTQPLALAKARSSSTSSFKSLFRTSSTAAIASPFTIKCTKVPMHIFPDQPITLDLALRGDQESLPKLQSCSLDLIATTSSSSFATTTTVAESSCSVPSSLPAALTFDSFPSNIPSTFAFNDLTRQYKLRCSFTFCSSAGSLLTATKEVDITLHPPLLEEAQSPMTPQELLLLHQHHTPLPGYESVLEAGATPGYFDYYRDAPPSFGMLEDVSGAGPSTRPDLAAQNEAGPVVGGVVA